MQFPFFRNGAAINNLTLLTRVILFTDKVFIGNCICFVFFQGIMMKITLDYVNKSYTNYYYAAGIVLATLASHVLRTTLFSFCMIIGSVSGLYTLTALFYLWNS